MDKIYFDNSSTTIAYPEVAVAVNNALTLEYGNPSSMHEMGVEAEKLVRLSRERISDTLKVSPRDIYFTSGGTESNNWAIIGTALAKRRAGKHIITSGMEHPSVSEPISFLEKEGFEVTRIGVDEKGRLRMDELESALRSDTILVSVMLVNNEMGAVTDPCKIGHMIKKKSPEATYHADAIQAYGKYIIEPKKAGIDLLSVSGHKIHGPKGIGFLYKNPRTKLRPIIYGGGQQEGMRSGTDNVPGIAGLGQASEICHKNIEKNREILYGLKEHLVNKLAELEDVRIHGLTGRDSAPHIVNASFIGVGSEVLLHSLEDKGIYVSAGSACSTHKKSKSPTLTAMGCPKEELDSSVRFSFCETNTKEEIDKTLAVLAELLPVLRKYKAY